MKQENFVKLMRSKVDINHPDFYAMKNLCILIAGKCMHTLPPERLCICDAKDPMWCDQLKKTEVGRPTWHGSIHIPTLFCLLWDNGILDPKITTRIEVETRMDPWDGYTYSDPGKLKIWLPERKE